MKKLKIKIRGFLVIKIMKYRKEIKIYKDKLADNVLKEREYIDKMNLMQDEIRQLLLKLTKEERELWLKEKGKDYERHTPKKERTKRKINKIKHN